MQHNIDDMDAKIQQYTKYDVLSSNLDQGEVYNIVW